MRRYLRQLLASVAAFTFLFFVITQLGTGSGGEVKEERLQKWISRPGSSPPTCRSKCGRCSPCRPVHVPIQPGLKLPLDYYPEAWRCKCGNRLFMP